MIEVVLISLLVVLIIANLGLKVYNVIYPPCERSEEYFDSARKLSNESINVLSTIPTGVDLHNVHNSTVSLDMQYDQDNSATTEMTNNITNTLLPPPIINKTLVKALDNMFSGRTNDKNLSSTTEKKRTKYKDGNSGIFESEMEGLKSNNDHVSANRVIMKPSGFVKVTQTDGYSDRNPNEF
jgi:hypothetical protein